MLACFGVFYLSFAQAVIVNSFQEVLREHRRTDDGGKQLKRIFDAQRKDPDGRVKCADLHRAVRRYDATLATSLEAFLPLDDMQKREHDKRRESGESVHNRNDPPTAAEMRLFATESFC